MFDYDENHYLRKCFFQRDQVPTQTVMNNKMSSLAKVYFKSMAPKLKTLAGLQPVLKGGGTDWYVPPEKILKGEVALNPIDNRYLAKLGYKGIEDLGSKFVQDHHERMEREKQRRLDESDAKWLRVVKITCDQDWDDRSKHEVAHNTRKLREALKEFEAMYKTSITKLESILIDASTKTIQQVEEETQQHMENHYRMLLTQQVNMLHDRYTNRLKEDMGEMKKNFIENVETLRTETATRIHDVNVEKHVAIEKLRKLLECQNLACQVYVALKEREHCEREISQLQHDHLKAVKKLNEDIAFTDMEIRYAKEKEKQRHKFNRIWQKKVCRVVKKFQLFVSYCLQMLPGYAEFFINTEKLMMLHIKEIIKRPETSETIFEEEMDTVSDDTPPMPEPFVLYGEFNQERNVDANLCPNTIDTTDFPVMVINKKYIYAACDNFQLFTDKVRDYIYGQRTDPDDLMDDMEEQLEDDPKAQDVTFQSSLIRLLRQDVANFKEVETQCKCICNLDVCFCSDPHSTISLPVFRQQQPEASTTVETPDYKKITSRKQELHHDREPKWDSYVKYVTDKRCRCPTAAKKTLNEHMPPYMMQTSKYQSPTLPNYKKCPLHTLKDIVEKSQGGPFIRPVIQKTVSRTREMCTQYSDEEYDLLCDCFSDDELTKLLKMFDEDKMKGGFEVLGDKLSPDYLTRHSSSFVTERALSLQTLLKTSPDLRQLFKKKHCD